MRSAYVVIQSDAWYIVIRTHDGPKISGSLLCFHTIFGSDYYSSKFSLIP